MHSKTSLKLHTTTHADSQLQPLLDAGNQLDACASAVLLAMCKVTYSSPTWDAQRRELIAAIDRWRTTVQPDRISPLPHTAHTTPTHTQTPLPEE